MFGKTIVVVVVVLSCVCQLSLSCRSKVDDEREPILAKHVSTIHNKLECLTITIIR
jgi:hypothetical protein